MIPLKSVGAYPGHGFIFQSFRDLHMYMFQRVAPVGLALLIPPVLLPCFQRADKRLPI